MMWIVALIIVVVARLGTRSIKEVPHGLQNFVEWIVESLRNFLESVIGRDLTAKAFWFFASAFIFILFTNWFGLFPGVGTVGYGTTDAHGHWHLETPLLRGANADLNMTLAMAIVFFISWIFWSLRENGLVGFLKHIFGAKGDAQGGLKVLMIVVFFLVGILEIVSIAFRPVSLSFRLYGNIFAGETMLEAMSELVPDMLGRSLIPVPFYFMELLVGMAQALVFTLLTAVFTFLMCDHGPEGHGDDHGKAHH